jgi:hypothetical protein
MRPSLQGREARDLNVSINDTTVRYTLDATSQKLDPYGRSAIQTRGASNKLRCAILDGKKPSGASEIWEDTDNAKLETHLTDIVVELIVAGERQYRKYRQGYYEWLVEYKTELIEKRRKLKEEAERKERERIAAMEKARIERLLGSATAFRQAADIRSFVADVEERYVAGELTVSEAELNAWSRWALEQADRIDPVRSGRLMDTMRDPETPDCAPQF